MPTNEPQAETEFRVTDRAGEARAGTLTVAGRSMETPNLFPVINFYGGGTEDSVYGGSTHRTVKELINGAERMFGISCSDAFPGAMMSVGSLTDYGISRERLDDYLSEPVHQRAAFRGFDGILFTDSGGYKNLTKGGLDGSDFEIKLDQQRVFAMQMQLGGDILINLDYPILDSDSDAERRRKARQTAENAVEFLQLAEDAGFNGARYLSVHGFYHSQLDTFMTELTETFGTIDIESAFDGIALGSLVPKKDNKGDLIRAVRDCREVMSEYGIESLPLHVLGISSSAIPLLVAVGADTFDSSSYIQSAVNAKYYESLTDTTRLENADLTQCSCPVCSSPEMRKRIRGDAEYRKDRIGPIAVHNQYVQQRELKNIRSAIRESGTDGLVRYIEDSVGRNQSLRRFAHRVVEESLGGYF